MNCCELAVVGSTALHGGQHHIHAINRSRFRLSPTALSSRPLNKTLTCLSHIMQYDLL